MPENGPYSDLAHFDRATDELACPSIYFEDDEPIGLQHVAVAAYRAAALDTGDLTPFDEPRSVPREATHQRPAGPPSYPAGRDPLTF